MPLFRVFAATTLVILLTMTLPIAEEFQVNEYTTNDQETPAVATDASGNFVVVWSTFGQDGSQNGVFARRYDASGAPLSLEFQVNSFTTADQVRPDVAMNSAGEFVVVWASYAQDGSDFGIFGQKFEAGGGFDGGEFAVNSDTGGRQNYPRVDLNDAGEFVVVWDSYLGAYQYDVFGRRFDSLGPVATEFQVNSYTTDYQVSPQVAVGAGGDFVVVWESCYQDGSDEGIFARRFDNSGSALSSDFPINTTTLGSQSLPSVAMDGSGGFVVVWQSEAQDGSAYGIFAQRFDAAGAEQGVEFAVNTYTSSQQERPDVAAHDDGSFVVTWQSFSQDGDDHGVFAQNFDADGSAAGSELQVNLYTTGDQEDVSIAVQEDGAVVVWESRDLAAPQDGSQSGVFGRRLADTVNSSQLDVAVCGSDAHYAWVRFEDGGTNPDILYRRCAVGGACSSSKKLVGAPTAETSPVVACSGSNLLVLWEDRRNGNPDLAYRRSVDGGASFSGLQFLVQGAGDETGAALAMDGNTVLAVWEDDRNGNRDLATRRSVDGGASWGALSFLVKSPLDDSDPVLELDGSAAFLGWIDRRHGSKDIAYRRSADTGLNWLGLTFLVRAPSQESQPAVALDGSNLLVVWNDTRWGNADLAYRRSLNSGAAFSGLTFLVRAPSDDTQPVVRVSGSDGVLAWVDERSDNRSISYRRSGDAGAGWGATARLVSAPTDEFDPACDLAAGLAACGWTDERTGSPVPNKRDSVDGGLTWSQRQELD